MALDTLEDAARLVLGLHTTVDGHELVAAVEGTLWPDARIVFRGGRTGEHSLSIQASDRARVLAHWAGYVENNGGKLEGFAIVTSEPTPSGRRQLEGAARVQVLASRADSYEVLLVAASKGLTNGTRRTLPKHSVYLAHDSERRLAFVEDGVSAPEPLFPVQSFFPERSARWVNDTCRAGRIHGAVKIGRQWMIRASQLPGAPNAKAEGSAERFHEPTVEEAMADLRRRGIL